MVIRAMRLVGVSLLLFLTSSLSAQAAGLLIADGGLGGVLELKEQAVDVTINNGIAVTQVDQTFLNTENRIVEALYTFPVPKGGAVSNFSMWINGKEMIGEVVEKERAREIYNSYKRRNVDPGLLEQVDYKTFEMRVFPIAAGAEQRVRFSYYQHVDIDHDRATYVYPLATVSKNGVDQRTSGKLAVTMKVLSEVPIASVDSPSHGQDFVVASHSPKYYEASYETDGGDLSRDFVLSYQTKRPKTGVDIVTSKPAGEDGYFMMTITAGEELEEMDQAMDYVFVVDISGSMAHDGKLAASRNTIQSFVEALSPEDRFELLAFNVSPTTLFKGLQKADDASIQQAKEFLMDQSARGGTSLTPAMHLAYKYGEPDRPLNIVILSDGMTEQGENTELLRLIRQRPKNATVFAVGVGNEVNRPLLSQMADDAGGLAAFISRGDDFKRQAESFRRKLVRPAAANVQLAISGVNAYDVVPAKLPNLYHGLPIRVVGRYRGGSDFNVELTSDVRGKPLTIQQSLISTKTQQPEIERMWAFTRIKELVRQADLAGSRSIAKDEVVALGERYSIASEFTSFLVLENNDEYKRWKIDRLNVDRLQRDRASRDALRDRLQKLRSESLSQLGPSKEADGKPRQFEMINADPIPSINTPEPSSGLMLLMTLWPLLHLARRRRRR